MSVASERIRTCRDCGESKPRKKFKTRDRCHTCYNRYYYKPRPAHDNDTDRRLPWKFGITANDVKALMEKQHGKCPICSRELAKDNRRAWHIDHCHVTRKVRGLLCAGCNVALGLFKDDKDIFLRALLYLDGKL